MSRSSCAQYDQGLDVSVALGRPETALLSKNNVPAHRGNVNQTCGSG